MDELNIVNALHTATERDYLDRVNSVDKAWAAEKALNWGYDYWDGSRQTGYGGYKYDGRWRTVADQIIEKYQDDQAFMAHMTRFVTEEYIPKLLTMQEIVSIEMPGLVTKEIEDFFTAGGWKYKDNIVSSSGLYINESVSNTHQIGSVMYTEYILYFQLSGVILLLSMIGAIILTYRKRENVKTQSYFKQISRDKSSAVILKEVKFNQGVKIDD